MTHDFTYLDLSRMAKGGGPEGCGAYAGFAPMLLDHIGSKIGSAFLSALRRQAYEGGLRKSGMYGEV